MEEDKSKMQRTAFRDERHVDPPCQTLREMQCPLGSGHLNFILHFKCIDLRVLVVFRGLIIIGKSIRRSRSSIRESMRMSIRMQISKRNSTGSRLVNRKRNIVWWWELLEWRRMEVWCFLQHYNFLHEPQPHAS